MARLTESQQRILRAFAEAMAPGVGPLPPAAGNEPAPGSVDVVAALEPLLESLPARSVRQIGLGLRAFDWLTFPWRFSRAGLEARQDFLREVEESGSAFKRDIALFLKIIVGLAYGNDPEVQEAVGYRATCEAADPARSGRRRRLAARRPRAAGPGGGLRRRGGRIRRRRRGRRHGPRRGRPRRAGARGGPHVDRRSYPEEPLAALTTLYRDGGLTVARGRPAIPTPVGRAVGGTTVINSGTCFRAPDHVLEEWRDEHGIAWATDLEPDFAQAEEMLAVRAVDPERMGRNGQLMRAGAEALGISHRPLLRNAGECHQCSSCPNGCRIDAKRAMHVSYLPRAVAAGARVRAGVEARKIVFDGKRATGVECRAGVADARAEGHPFTVRARRGVVLAGGAFGTPELLLRSGFKSAERRAWAQPAHPSGLLGRGALRRGRPRLGRGHAELRGRRVGAAGHPARGDLHPARLRRAVVAGDRGRAPGAPARLRPDRIDRRPPLRQLERAGGARARRLARVGYKLTRDDAERLVFGIARAAEIFYAAGAREVYPQISGVGTIAPEAIADLEASSPPRSGLRLEAFHPMGTARMDADPRRGVTAPDGSVHGAEGLYVADGSLFPSSIGVNPMMTIIAMASRVSTGLAATLA